MHIPIYCGCNQKQNCIIIIKKVNTLIVVCVYFDTNKYLFKTKIQYLQKQLQTCFKLITITNPTRENFHREKMLMLGELIKVENQRFGFKLHNGLLPIKLENLMWTDSKSKSLMKLHHYNTRQRKLPRLPKAQSRKYYCSFQFRSMSDFGNLPSKLRNSFNLKSFTRSVKWLVLNTN